MVSEMTEIDIALDDLISKQRPMARHNSGKRRAGIDEPLTPAFRTEGRNNRFGGAGNLGGRRHSGSFGGNGRFGFVAAKRRFEPNNDVVWINIANLPDTVVTADLQELFQDFNVKGLGVHYDEFGQHMGTADLFVNSHSAKAILREYANVAIDGQKIRFAIVNEQAADTPQFQSHQSRIGGRQFIRPRRNWPVGGDRSDSGQSTRTYSRSRSPIDRGQANTRSNNIAAGAGGQRKNSMSARQMKSSDDLDKELEAYMRGNKHPRIKLGE